MKAIDYWRLCDQLSVRQAALLVMGEDPGDYMRHHEVEKPYDAIVQAMNMALVARPSVLKGEPVHNEYGFDAIESLVDVASLKQWLLEKGIRTGFFFPDGAENPDYLNIDHPLYSPKLAAAVSAWVAVTGDKRYINNGKSPKANIENWLTANAEKFGLVSEDGEINNTAIKDQISKVVNWSLRGGSPTTPISEPAPLTVEPDPVNFDDDSEIPF